MPLSNIQYQTEGTWETSVVTHMGNPIDWIAIKLNLQSNTFLEDDPGGVDDGVSLNDARIIMPNGSETAFDQINNLVDQGLLDDAYDYCSEMQLFPGEISILSPTLQELRVVFDDPYLVTNNIRVFLEGIEVTQDLCEIMCDIDYIQNTAECYITLTTDRRFLSHSNETIKIL